MWVCSHTYSTQRCTHFHTCAAGPVSVNLLLRGAGSTHPICQALAKAETKIMSPMRSTRGWNKKTLEETIHKLEIIQFAKKVSHLRGVSQVSHPRGQFINSVQTRCIAKGEAQKSPLFWRFSGSFWFSQERLSSWNSPKNPLNLIKSPICTNTPCKPTCLYNAPSMHTVEFISKSAGKFLASLRGANIKEFKRAIFLKACRSFHDFWQRSPAFHGVRSWPFSVCNFRRCFEEYLLPLLASWFCSAHPFCGEMERSSWPAQPRTNKGRQRNQHQELRHGTSNLRKTKSKESYPFPRGKGMFIRYAAPPPDPKASLVTNQTKTTTCKMQNNQASKKQTDFYL